MNNHSQRKKGGDARETIWRHEAKQGKMILDMPVDAEITLTPNHNKTKVNGEC